MITLPLTTAQLIVAVFILAPVVCALTTLVTNRLDTRAQRAAIKNAWNEIAACNRMLDERAEIQAERTEVQDGRDASLSEREAAVTIREKNLRLRAREAHATLDSEAEQFDTMISVMDWELPHPNQWEDTVEVPAVEEDE